MKERGKSTGPTSDAGKLVSSGNGITHGCTARVFRLMKGEEADEFDTLRRSWERGYEDLLAVDENFGSLLRMAAEAEWLLWRNQRRFALVDADLSDDLTQWGEQQHQQLEQATRYLTTAERRYHRFRQAVEQVRRSRHLEEHRVETRVYRAKSEACKDEDCAAKRENEQKKTKEKGPTREEKRREVDETKARLAEIERTRQPQVHQYVELAKGADGALVTKKRPTNEELLKHALEKEPSATQVWRHMWFPRELPAEYAWVETADSGTINPRLQIMPFEQWKELIEWEEKELGTHIGPLKRDEFWSGE